MNLITKPRLLGLLASLILFTAHAGWNFRNVAHTVTSIPLGGEMATPFGLSLADSLNANYGLISTPLPPADLATLKQFAPFDSMTDEQILEKIVVIRRAVLESIETIRLEKPELADCLLHLYRNRRICISFGGNPNVAAEIRENGSRECGDEAMNLYHFPCPAAGITQLPLYDTNVVRLLNSIAHEGLHAIQDGYHGGAPGTPIEQASWALTNQCREVEASTQEVERLTALETVLSRINSDLSLPPDASGIAARVGGSILKDDSLTDAQKRRKARDLLTIIDGELKPAAEQTLQCREVYKQALQMFIAGQLPSGSPYNDIVKRTGWYRVTTIRTLGEFRLITLLAGGAHFDGSGVLRGDHSLRQIALRDDATQEEFTFDPGLDFVSGGFRWGSMLLIGGDDESTREGVVKGYLDTDDDGIIDEASGREIWRSSLIYGGLSFAPRPVTGNPVVLSRRFNELYELSGTDPDGFPSMNTEIGSLSTRLDDLLYFSFSANGKYAVGYNDLGISLGKYTRWAEARFDEGTGSYEPFRTSQPYQESELNPALSELPMAGQTCLKASGSPGAVYQAYLWQGMSMSMLDGAKADPNGSLIFHFDQPLQAGDKFLFGGAAANCWSPEYTTYASGAPRLFQPRRVDRSGLQYQAFGVARAPYGFECSEDLSTWTQAGSSTSGRFGNTFLSGTTTGEPAMFWRGFVQPRPLQGEADYFSVPPGIGCEFHPAYNDFFPEGSTFQLTMPTDLHPDRFDFTGNGSFTYTAMTFDGPVTFSYKIMSNGSASPPITVMLIPDFDKLVRPPVVLDPATGIEAVTVPCLVFAGKHYPIYQFRVANHATDICKEPHWHSSGLVFSFETPTEGITDPDPDRCGHGTLKEVPQEDFTLPANEWEDFKIAHFPPF